LDLLAIRIAKAWNRDPEWFYTLEPETQIKVLANHRIETSSPQEIKDRQEANKRAKMKAMIAKSIGE
jgi:hypothetical protein